MRIRTQVGYTELGQGETFRVTFNGRGQSGHPYGVVGNYKVIPSYHDYSIRHGETWDVEEITRWGSGSDRPENNTNRQYQSWGSAIYVRGIRRVG